MTDNLLMRWIIIVLIVAAAIASIAMNWGEDGPLNLGIDLRGGYSITYSISEKSLEEVIKAGEDPKEALDQTITVISTRIDTLGLREMTVRSEGTNRIVIQAPKLSPEEVEKIKERMLQLGKLEFMIGVDPDLMTEGQSKPVDVPGKIPGQVEKYVFNKEKAEAQRQKAIESGEYRDGTVYQLKADDGRPLPIYWVPWTPGAVSERYGIPEDKAREALRNARAGKPYDKDLIKGAWLYKDPDFWDEGEPGFTGRDISDVRKSVDRTGARAVTYSVNRDRQADFEEYTEKYVQWPMAIVLNDELWSAPIIKQALSDNVMIDGGARGFSPDDQAFLVTALQSGSLKLRPIEEGSQEIAASLGTDSVNRGVWSAILGMVLVMVFLIYYYKFGGLIANLALLLNLFLLIAILALFQATLTLPGIAGIILTIGMAVDANILIFARVREEMAKGKTLVASLQAGYARAFVTIVDANLTTFITAVILYQYGVGPIKGFAVTLMAGIVCSLFSGVFFTRSIFGVLLKREMLKKLSMRTLVPPDLRVDFLGKSRIAVAASLIAVVLSLVIFTAAGEEKYGLDFTGGTVVRANFKKPVSTSEVAKIIKSIREAGAEKYTQVDTIGIVATQDPENPTRYQSMEIHVQSRPDLTPAFVKNIFEGHLRKIFGDQIHEIRDPREDKDTGAWNMVFVLKEPLPKDLVRKDLDGYQDERGRHLFEPVALTPLNAEEDPTTGEIKALEFDLRIPKAMLAGQDVAKDIQKHLGELLDPANPFGKIDFVGPNVVAGLKKSAIVAIVLSLIAVILYIWFRFKELKYGVAAALAVFHDVIIALGIVVLCNEVGLVHSPLNLAIIAGFLTIIGYSLNDTIVLFDRVRENLGNIRGSFEEIINISINQTLGRTVLTSLTTFVVVSILFIFNYRQESPVEGIAFTLCVGIVVGTYSSIYIASPLVIWLEERGRKKLEASASK